MKRSRKHSLSLSLSLFSLSPSLSLSLSLSLARSLPIIRDRGIVICTGAAAAVAAAEMDASGEWKLMRRQSKEPVAGPLGLAGQNYCLIELRSLS